MSPLVRKLLYPVAIVLVIVGFIVGEILIFGGIAVVLIIASLAFYSGRKQRVRYWYQGYLINMKQNNNDNSVAIEAMKKDFCAGKYADEKICNKSYENVDELVEEIIKREFKFMGLMGAPMNSAEDVSKNLGAYTKAVKKLKQEIVGIKSELGIHE